MKKQDFLNNLRKEGKLEIVEPSEEICDSYLKKADNCLRSAKILLKNSLYENSVSMAYYAMYNPLTALLFKIGIKCKNHSGSILLLKKIFKQESMYKIISSAKKERIDREYYITSKKGLMLTEKLAKDMMLESENFLIKVKLLIKSLNSGEITKIRESFILGNF